MRPPHCERRPPFSVQTLLPNTQAIITRTNAVADARASEDALINLRTLERVSAARAVCHFRVAAVGARARSLVRQEAAATDRRRDLEAVRMVSERRKRASPLLRRGAAATAA